jgi:hypothetical protein
MLYVGLSKDSHARANLTNEEYKCCPVWRKTIIHGIIMPCVEFILVKIILCLMFKLPLWLNVPYCINSVVSCLFKMGGGGIPHLFCNIFLPISGHETTNTHYTIINVKSLPCWHPRHISEMGVNLARLPLLHHQATIAFTQGVKGA